MSIQNATAPAGKLFCISRGEYSDYRYQGHFLALVDITREMLLEVVEECKAAARKENKEEWGDDDDSYGADDKFLPALIRRGWVMDVDCIEIHTGSYGELDIN